MQPLPGENAALSDVPVLTGEDLLHRLVHLLKQFIAGLAEIVHLAYNAFFSGSLELAAKKDDNLRSHQHAGPAGSHARRAQHMPLLALPAHKHQLHGRHHHGHLHTAGHRYPLHSPGLHRQLSAPVGGLPQQQQHPPAGTDAHRHPHSRLRAGLLSPRLPPSSLLSPRDPLSPQPQHPQQLRPGGMPEPLPLTVPAAALRRLSTAGDSSSSGQLVQQPGAAGACHEPLDGLPSTLEAAAAPTAAAGDAGPHVLEIPVHELEMGPEIGRGCARVYAARWRGANVAVKVLDSEACSRASALEEFQRELAILAQLPPHPNVLPLIGACTQAGSSQLALVTQFCPCGSLYMLLHSPAGEQLTWWQLVAMLLGTARGVAHLHAHGVLHRDLKSGNLLLEQDLNVRLADFGLSRLTWGSSAAAAAAGPLTGGLGTHQWMAPEVLARQHYSEKADCYSFGIIMYECASRQLPYAGMDGVQAALAVMNRGLRPDIPAHTPPPFAALMSACWAPVPGQRPAFHQVVAELEGWLQQMDSLPVNLGSTAAQQQMIDAAGVSGLSSGGAGQPPLIESLAAEEVESVSSRSVDLEQRHFSDAV